MFNLKQYEMKRLNVSLIITVIILCCISAFTVRLGVGNTFFKKQIFGLVAGIMVLAIVSIIDYHFLCRFVAFFYVGIVGILLLVRFSPLGTDNGTKAKRWLRLGIDIQPSDFAKIVIILTLAVILTRLQEKLDKFHIFFLICFVAMVPTLLIYIQPNLSTSIVMMFILFTMIFAAGLSYKIIITLLSIGIPGGAAFLWYVLQPGVDLLKKYQVTRIKAFFNPTAAGVELGTGYQQSHSVTAISSGKIYGKLILDGPSNIRGYNSVDVTESDFIYSIIGEEYGFIGGCIIMLLLAIIIIRCLLVARKATDQLGMLIAIGISSMLMCQVFVNIGVATFLLPNTGIPLPFISYGLSSLFSNMIAMGFIINIGIQKSIRR